MLLHEAMQVHAVDAGGARGVEADGDQVGPGKKSLAFALRFRAPDRTLTNEEANAARDAAVAVAADRFCATLR